MTIPPRLYSPVADGLLLTLSGQGQALLPRRRRQGSR